MFIEATICSPLMIKTKYLFSNKKNIYPFYKVGFVFGTTKVESSNPAHGEMYSIQHCVIKYVSDLR
jgi:predicted choloylglycine hydrolase